MGKVYITQTKNIGKGIFAKTNIKKNKIIFIFKGKSVKRPYDSKYRIDSRIGSHWFAINKNTWIKVPMNNPGYFINHSCKPNAGVRGKVTVVAMKNIKKGEEVTIDYSTTEEDPYWKMKCKCGKRECRKVIRSVQFLYQGLFKKYKPFIPKFLQKSYMLTHNFNVK